MEGPRESTLWEAASVADNAPIFVYAVNYPKYKVKENKTQALVSALMLTVAGSGLFAASSLTKPPSQSWDEFNQFRQGCILFFCVSTFCFMTAVILSYIFMVLFLTDPTLTIKDAQKGVGPMLYRMPKVRHHFHFITLLGKANGGAFVSHPTTHMALCDSHSLAPITGVFRRWLHYLGGRHDLFLSVHALWPRHG